MSEHDALAEGFRALRAVTDAGLRPPGAADAVVRYRKRRARRATVACVVVASMLSVALYSSLGHRRVDPGPAASPTATTSPFTSPSPSVTSNPQTTVMGESPQSPASPDTRPKTPKALTEAECQLVVGLEINSADGGYKVGVISSVSTWRNGPCAGAKIWVFWAVYSYAASGPRPRINSATQYVTVDSPTVILPLQDSGPCASDSWVIAQGLTIPAAIPSGVTSRDALRNYVRSLRDGPITEHYGNAPCVSPTPSP